MLTDAGPLVALFDRNDADHQRCTNVTRHSRRVMISTWPVFTEAMYLLGRRMAPNGRWHAQQQLWSLLIRGDLVVRTLGTPEIVRSFELMRQYRDLPMDLADATLVAVAEAIDSARIFTLDKHFSVYRFRGRRRFEIVPERGSRR